jgi:hypothetical protein
LVIFPRKLDVFDSLFVKNPQNLQISETASLQAEMPLE